MALTVTTHFVGNISLPNMTTGKAEWTMMASLIAKYEPEMLIHVLGYTMYTELQTNIADVSGIWYDYINGDTYTDQYDLTAKWDGFTVGFNPIARYCYCLYQRQVATQTMGIGERRPTGENMAQSDATAKVVAAWNDMVDTLIKMHYYLIDHETDFPDYIGHTYSPLSDDHTLPNRDYFKKINVFGI